MSDNARESFVDKASAALKPDSQKSGTEQIKDSIKGKADSLASSMQPESHKSSSQKAADTVSDNSNHNDKSLLDSAKEAIGMGGNSGK